MNQTVRITEITPPPLNTRQPWKFKDGNGLILKTFNPVIGRFIQDHLGQLLALDYETQTNGNFTDNIVKSAVPAEVTPEIKTSGQTGWRPDPTRDMKESERNRFIVRENALTNAVNLTVGALGRGRELTEEEESRLAPTVLKLAEHFVEWIHESGPKNSGKVTEQTVQEVFPGAEKIGPKSKT